MYGGDFEDLRPPDSDEEGENDPPSSWRNDAKVSEPIELLFVAENETAVDFVRRCLVKDEYEIDNAESTKVRLYRIPGTGALVCTSLCRDDGPHGEIVGLLTPLLKRASRTVGIQTLPLARYRTDGIKDSDIVRSVSVGDSDSPFPKLETPNFITGVVAGTLNYCDQIQSRCTVHVFYLESDIFGFDEKTAQKLTDLCKRLGIPILEKYTGKKITSTTYM